MRSRAGTRYLLGLVALMASAPARAGDPPAHAAAMLQAARMVAAKPAFAMGVGPPTVAGAPVMGRFLIPTDGSLACPLVATGFGVGCAYDGVNQEAINEPDDWHCDDPRQPPKLNAINDKIAPFQASLADLLAIKNDKYSVVCNWSHFASNPGAPSATNTDTAHTITAAWADEIPANIEMYGAIPDPDFMLVEGTQFGQVPLRACDAATWKKYYQRIANALHYLEDQQSEHHREGNLLCSQDNELVPAFGTPIKKIQDGQACFGWLFSTVASATGPGPVNRCDEAVVEGDPSNPTLNSNMSDTREACFDRTTLACMGLERTLRHHCLLTSPPDLPKTLVCTGPADDHSAAQSNLAYCEGELFSAPGGQDFLTLATSVSTMDIENAALRWAAVCKEPDDPCVPAQCDKWCQRTVGKMSSAGATQGYCQNSTPDAQCTLHQCTCGTVQGCGTLSAPCCTQGAACSDPTLECGGETGTCVPKGQEVCSADLIVNGGFESPAVSDYQLLAPGSTIPGWTVVGATGNVALLSRAYTESGFTFTAQAGEQSLDLTGLSNTAGTGVSQVVKTVAGTLYHLSFWVGNVVDPAGVFGSTSTVDVVIDGAPAIPQTSSGGGDTPSWQQFMVDFTAASTTTTIEFLNGDPSSDNSNLLDGVSLKM